MKIRVMGQVPGHRAKRSRHKTLLFVLTNVVSLACLWWVLHDQKWAEFWDDLKTMHWGWVSLAVTSDILVYVIHGWRWSLLLKPVEEIPVLRSVRAIYVGLFANEILPFRTGELIRCYLQAEWSSIPFSVTLSSALAERVFDGLWLMVALGVTVKLVPGLPKYVIEGGLFIGGIVVIGAAVLALAMFHKHRMHAMLSGKGWQRHFLILIEDLYLIGHSRYLYYSALAGVAYLALQIIPFWAMLHAYGFVDASLGISAMLMVVLRMSSAVPQAPGNVGAFQALLAAMLVFLGYGHDYAKRFSVIMWAVITIPLLIVGSIALIITGVRIDELHKHAKAEIPVVEA
jgi:glycosyltransferase 2 family protein